MLGSATVTIASLGSATAAVASRRSVTVTAGSFGSAPARAEVAPKVPGVAVVVLLGEVLGHHLPHVL